MLVVLVVAVATIVGLNLRKQRGSQTEIEHRIFHSAGQAKELAKRAYEAANSQYSRWQDEQTAQRQQTETLRRLEQERKPRWDKIDRLHQFFDQAYSGSDTALNWWTAYQDERHEAEGSEIQPSPEEVSTLLKSTRDRADDGLRETQRLKSSVDQLLQEDLFGDADHLIGEVREGQEDLQGEKSIFGPLVQVHNRIKGMEEWTHYREELEVFIKNLEDLFSSPNVRTAAANRVRFPNPKDSKSHAITHSGFSTLSQTKTPLSGKEYIETAIPVMLGRGFSVVNRSDSHVTFFKSGSEMNGATCLVSVLLLFMGIIPGILYAIYLNTRKAHVTLSVVEVGGETKLYANGNDRSGESTLQKWIVDQGLN